jgi:lysozyme family protein
MMTCDQLFKILMQVECRPGDTATVGRGFVDDPVDAGGPTVWGISTHSMRYQGRPSGLECYQVDEVMGMSRKPIETRTPEEVRWYDHQMSLLKGVTCAAAREWFCRHYHLDIYRELPDDLQTTVFLFAVHAGHGMAARYVQLALVRRGVAVTIDGVWGEQTKRAVASADPALLATTLRDCIAGYYLALTIMRPPQRRFLSGWLRRLEVR